MFNRAHIIPSVSKGGAEKILSKVIEVSEETCVVLVFKRSVHEIKIKAEVVKLFSIKGIHVAYQIVQRGTPVSAWLYSAYLIGMLLKLLNSKIPLTLHVRNGRPFKLSHNVILSAVRFFSYVSSRNIKAVFNSDSSLRAHRKYIYRFPVEVVHNGVDYNSHLNFNKFSESNLNVLIVALFREEKRYDKMLAVISHFNDHTDINFHIAGPSPNEIRKLAEDLSLEFDNCKLYGRLEEVDFLYQLCQVNLLLSDTESFSNVILESAVHGLFNVVSNVGDSHLIVKDSGVLVTNVSEAIDAIKEYKSAPLDFRLEKAKNIRETVETDFDANIQMTKLLRAELCVE